ncbi:MAG: signal peptidase [Streptomyces sp.]|jgi:signal peptidase I|nr:signal peptidase [Streptomyces sp.]
MPPLLTGTSRVERRKLARKVKRKRRRSLVKEVPLLVMVALLIALVLKTFLVQAFVIPSGSMEETIQIGDRVLVDKLTPWFGSKPQRGDVVVFKDPGDWLSNEPQPKPDPVVVKQVKQVLTYIGLLPASGEQDLIKRVIGVGGDTVQCCDATGHITVNGQPLTEPYLFPGNPPSMMKFTVHVPEGRLWVMGDHRSDSADSRYHMDEKYDGTIAENLVVGRAFVIAWPFNHWQRMKDPGTFSSVPDPPATAAASAAPATSVGSANNGQRINQLPTPAELPLVVGAVGLRRRRGRRKSRVRSGCGGPGGRRTVWTRRAREGGRRGTARTPGAAGEPGGRGVLDSSRCSSRAAVVSPGAAGRTRWCRRRGPRTRRVRRARGGRGHGGRRYG